MVTFPLGPGVGYTWVDVGIVEAIFTFFLTLIVLSVQYGARSNTRDFLGFTVGACVVAGGFVAGGISGGAMNPAIAICIAGSHVLNGGFFWKAVVYAISEILGCVCAAGVFRLIYAKAIAGARPSLVERPSMEPSLARFASA